MVFYFFFEVSSFTSGQVPLISISIGDCAACEIAPRVDDRRGALLMSELRRAAMLPIELLLPVRVR